MEIIQNNGAPIKSWAVNPEDGAIAQATNLSRLPFVISHVALMPDAHQGYGMPIGGVLFADKAIVPNAIGVDIGCGVQLIETDLTVNDISKDGFFHPEPGIRSFLNQVSRDIPTGNGPHGEHAAHNLTDENMWLPPDGLYMDERVLGVLDGAEKQLGTLGGGNHFLELQRSEDGRIWFMLHSGSRSVGKKICDYWDNIAAELNAKWHSIVPPYKEKGDRLAYLPWDTKEAQGYWNDMSIALAWAEENRRRMAGKVISAFGSVFGAKAWPTIDVHHNYAAWENHIGRNGIVHRKGAVRAAADEQVLIPGSMGTATYVAEGLGNVNSFNTCQHGAGRLRSRGATRKMTNLEEMDSQLSEAGVTLVTRDRNSVIDESPVAYKDIEEVMEASTDLIKPIMKLYPIGVVKG